MDLLIVYIILFIIISYLVVTYIKCVFYEPMLINKRLYCHSPSKTGNTTIRAKHFAKPIKGTNFSFNFWIYLENAPENVCRSASYDTPIDIFSMKQADDEFTLQINQHTSNLILKLSKNPEQTFNIIDALPNQKWINISINVENKYVDVFVDGKLYNAFYSPNIIKFLPLTNMTIKCAFGFYGYISKLRYFNSFIDYKRVNRLYKNNRRESGDHDLLWWIK